MAFGGNKLRKLEYIIPDAIAQIWRLGYVGFADEVHKQEKALGFAFDYIIVCTVTGSTQAGLLGVSVERNGA